MLSLLFCAAIAMPSFSWTQGLGNGWVIRKTMLTADNAVVVLAVVVPASQTKLPPGVGEAEPYEFVEGVVKDFNRNGVADSEDQFSFQMRSAVFVLLPTVESPNPHIMNHSSQSSAPHRVILEFLDESGCPYGRPEDMAHDSSGKLIIDLLAGPCRADR